MKEVKNSQRTFKAHYLKKLLESASGNDEIRLYRAISCVKPPISI